MTDGAGETRQGELALPAGEQTLGLQLKGLNANVMREKQERIQVQAMNLNGQPVQVEVAYKVYALDKEGKKGALRYEGKAESMQSFVPSGVWALPSGRYRMEVSAQDEKGRPCTAEQDFVLFSKTDRTSPVEETAWFIKTAIASEVRSRPRSISERTRKGYAFSLMYTMDNDVSNPGK